MSQIDAERQHSMAKGYRELVAEATAAVRTYSVTEAIDRYGDDDVVFVDVRDAPEQWQDGKIPGSVHASRGMLEFHIDPESPFHIDEFGTDKEFIFLCALGGRSALAAQRAQEMGLDAVATVEGGTRAWVAAGGPGEEVTPTM